MLLAQPEYFDQLAIAETQLVDVMRQVNALLLEGRDFGIAA